MIPRIGDIIMLREYQFSKVAKKTLLVSRMTTGKNIVRKVKHTFSKMLM